MSTIQELNKQKESFIKRFGEPIPLGLQWKIESAEKSFEDGKEEMIIYKLKNDMIQNVANNEEKECNCRTCLVAREEIKEIVKDG